jgi:CDP-diacylglycerol--serine O-phosphatidyltransferase
MAGRGTQWRYVVPSLLTCTSIALAFFSVAEAVSRRFESSAWLILLCVLLDKADGTAARLLKASTRFGVELDSLSDLIAFGVAPAVQVLSVLAEPPGGLVAAVPYYGYLVYASCALYVVAAALRLAKYNIVTEEYGNTHFFGIPTTAVGALVCCFYLTVRKYELSPVCIQALPLVMVFFALLMVSRIPIRKIGVRRNLPGNIFLFGNVFFVYLFGILRLFPEYLLSAGLLYTVGGSIWATAAGVRQPSPTQETAETGPSGALTAPEDLP